MKKLLLWKISIFLLIFSFFSFFFVQWISTISETNNEYTIRWKTEWKEIWAKLQDGESKCKDLSDENFGLLGGYFMGQMTEDSYEAMNNMMIQMMGEDGEEEMYIAMGKRISNCESNEVISQNMMDGGMMDERSNISRIKSFDNHMSIMDFGFGTFGWIFIFFFWFFGIIGIITLIKWVFDQYGIGNKNDKSALEIIKERYAKGEIDRKEFEEKKKDLS